MTTPPAPPPAAPRRTGRNILIGCAVLIVVCVVLAGIAFAVAGPSITKIFNAVAAPLTAGNDFMTAIVAKDYTKAQGMLSADLKSKITSGDDLKQAIIQQGGEVSNYSSSGFQFNDTAAIVTGTGQANGSTLYITMALAKEGDTWKVSGYKGSTTPPTATPTGS